MRDGESREKRRLTFHSERESILPRTCPPPTSSLGVSVRDGDHGAREESQVPLLASESEGD
jgi:hypothetical protein